MDEIFANLIIGLTVFLLSVLVFQILRLHYKRFYMPKCYYRYHEVHSDRPSQPDQIRITSIFQKNSNSISLYNSAYPPRIQFPITSLREFWAPPESRGVNWFLDVIRFKDIHLLNHPGKISFPSHNNTLSFHSLGLDASV